MCDGDFTIAELHAQNGGTSVGAIIEYALAQTHDARLAALQKLVDFACNELEQNKNEKVELSENALTTEICQMLRIAGISATHDEKVGGHCDIVVRGKEGFLWIAEAKIHDSYSWLNKGFKQLATRYTTGVHGQDHADILIYCRIQDALSMLKKWRQELLERNPDVVAVDSPCKNPLVFCSTHTHGSSGLDFHIRHKALALYWKPQDN